MDIKAIGQFIRTMRKTNKLTQADLAEKLCISSQAVSKWENGESLPDTMLLIDLSKVLNVSIDLILNAGCPSLPKKEKFEVLNVPKAFEAIKLVKTYLGEDSLFYIGMVKGISQIMNFDFEEALEKHINILYKEAIISVLNQGYYVEKEEVEQIFNDNYKTYEFIKSYDNKYWKDVYEKYKDRYTETSFWRLYTGLSYKLIRPEIFTEETSLV